MFDALERYTHHTSSIAMLSPARRATVDPFDHHHRVATPSRAQVRVDDDDASEATRARATRAGAIARLTRAKTILMRRAASRGGRVARDSSRETRVHSSRGNHGNIDTGVVVERRLRVVDD